MHLSRLPMKNCRAAVAVGVMAAVALIHIFRVGTYLRGGWFRLYYAYLSDVALPFAFYFLLTLRSDTIPFFRDWRARMVAIFAVAALAEVLQGLGVPALGRTFDPLDFAMYGGGVVLAAVADRFVLERLLPCWSREPATPSQTSSR